MKMQPDNNKYNLILFFIISILILLGWNYYFSKDDINENISTPTSNNISTQSSEKIIPDHNQSDNSFNLKQDLISIYTDNYEASIDTVSGDIRNLKLNKYNDTKNQNNQFTFFEDDVNNKFYVQTGLLNNNNNYILHNIPFQTEKKEYRLKDDVLDVILTQPKTDGIEVKKIYTFHKNKYIIDITYEIANYSNSPLELKAMYRMLRDGPDSNKSNFFSFNHAYTGPVIYTPEKFAKISFDDLNKGGYKYPNQTNTGWLGYIQHYFSAIWLLQPKNTNNICGKDKLCYLDISKRNSDNLYSVGFTKFLNPILQNTNVKFTTKLYAGPQEYNSLVSAADKLELVKDYGKVHIFASPLFWLLQKINSYLQNWGWSIILLVVLIKLILFPLNQMSFQSISKISKVAPKLKELKEIYNNDKMKMQQEIIALYKKEKINPLGGCLPMILQIPIFLGLYWALFNSVELRQASWIGWIKDLSRADPYYILPLIMALTTFLQTFLNPPPSDPTQAKMMKIIPIIFSVLFFFFPAGLVLYYIVNNSLSILQQWIMKKNIDKKVHP